MFFGDGLMDFDTIRHPTSDSVVRLSGFALYAFVRNIFACALIVFLPRVITLYKKELVSSVECVEFGQRKKR